MDRLYRNPLDDPAVRTWDAFVTGRKPGSDDFDQPLFSMLAKLQEASDAVAPADAFLHQLEAQLFAANRANQAASASLAPAPDPRFSSGHQSRFETRRPRLIAGYVLDRLAIAALLAVILTGLAVMVIASRSEPENAGPIPAIIDSRQELEQALNPPRMETLLDIALDPFALESASPADWFQLEFSLTRIEPGDEFSTDHTSFTCCPGIVVLQVLQGSAEFTIEGSAELHRAGMTTAEDVTAGNVYDLGPGDSVVFSMRSPAVIHNSGQEELQLLNGKSLRSDETRKAKSAPEGYRDRPLVYDRDVEPFDTEVVALRFERVVLNPGFPFIVESKPNEFLLGWYPETNAMLRMLFGAYEVLPADNAGSFLVQILVMHQYADGPYTLYNTGDNPATLHFMRIISSPAEPAASAEATPVASSEQVESLLRTVVDPASVGADSQSRWQSAAMSIIKLSDAKQFVLDESNWKSALDAFVVLNGEISVESGSPSQVIRAGSDDPAQLDAGTTTQLSSGDSWLAGIGTSLTVANSGVEEAELLMYHHGIERSLFGFGAGTIAKYPENFRPNLSHAEDPNPMTFSGPISLTLERVTISESDEFELDVLEGEMLLLFNEDGRAFQVTRDGSTRPWLILGGSAFYQYGAGAYSLTHFYGNDSLVIYIGRMSEATDALTADAG